MFDVLEVPTQTMTPPPDLVGPQDLVEELASVLAHRDRIDARAGDLICQIGVTDASRRDGYSWLTALLTHRMSLHPGEAQRLVARANGLTHTPLVALAYETGALSGAQVDVLLEARRTAPDAFTEAEGHLVAGALDTPLIRDLKKQLDYWLDQVAADDLVARRRNTDGVSPALDAPGCVQNARRSFRLRLRFSPGQRSPMTRRHPRPISTTDH
jgi:hypothetical protein